jgi:hypothetical protein
MKNRIISLVSLMLMASVSILISSCIQENFDQPPTNGSDPGITPNITIKALKSKYTPGKLQVITEDLILKGTIIADDASGNWYRTFVVQDETGGIEVLINIADSYVYYPAGREVYIKLKNLVLGDYNNLIQLGGFIQEDNSLGPIIDINGHLIKSVKKGLPAPKVKKITELTLDDVSTLVQIKDVQFISADTIRTFADAVTKTAYNRTLEDCNKKTVLVRTSGYATFAGTKLPKGNGTFTGVLSIYRSDLQFLVRDVNDLSMSGARCVFNPCAGTTITEVQTLNESFTSGSNNADILLTGWGNKAVKGSRKWIYKLFDGNVYAQSTAFNDSAPEMESWLITPGIKLTVPKLLTFETAMAFWTHDGLSVWISNNYVCDPTLATWQPVNCKIAAKTDTEHTFIPSGTIDLSGYTGTVFIGFKYVGSNSQVKTSTYRVDNVVVKNK